MIGKNETPPVARLERWVLPHEPFWCRPQFHGTQRLRTSTGWAWAARVPRFGNREGCRVQRLVRWWLQHKIGFEDIEVIKMEQGPVSQPVSMDVPANLGRDIGTGTDWFFEDDANELFSKGAVRVENVAVDAAFVTAGAG